MSARGTVTLFVRKGFDEILASPYIQDYLDVSDAEFQDCLRCVNPAHLYVGDALSNVRDMDLRKRRIARVPKPASKGEKNHQAKLTDVQVAEIRFRYAGRRGEQSALAREYGVTPQLIHLIVRSSYRALI